MYSVWISVYKRIHSLNISCNPISDISAENLAEDILLSRNLE